MTEVPGSPSSARLVMRGLDPRIHHKKVSLLRVMDCRVKPGNDSNSLQTHVFVPRRDAPELCETIRPMKIRGRRESRVRAAPAVSCAKMHKETHTSIQVQRKHSGLPCAMVLTVYLALSSATNSFCHRRQRIKVCLNPVGPTRLRWLDISNGCQDHTTSPYASAPFVRAPAKPLTSQNPPCDCRFAPTLPRPPHPVPRS